jgi:hypothetical protein
MGDMNTKVGSSNQGVQHIMGQHGMGEQNENGSLLIEFCASNDLVIGSTIFPHKTCHKATWVSLNQQTENQFVHLAISRSW